MYLTTKLFSQNLEEKSITFSVEVDSKFYSAPSKVTVENPNYHNPSAANNRQAPAGSPSALGLPANDGCLELPVKFTAKEPGVYPCRVTLRSDDDVRVYHIECGVTPEGSTARIEFATPVHAAITQEIPVVNNI